MTFTIFELLTNLSAPSEHIHLVILPPMNKENRSLAVIVWAQICRQISDRTLLVLRAGPRELSGPKFMTRARLA